MKKVLLLAGIASFVALTSCKKETQQEEVVSTENVATEDVTTDTPEEVATSDLENSSIPAAPQLQDETLQNWVNDLHVAAEKAKNASVAGNVDELNQATAEITSLVETLKTQENKAEYNQAQEYYKTVQEELNK
ncbi:hypothetical protein ACQ1Q5_02635 [Ornithobacterium rhinotracheale]|uniref:hypothetical protein n=1 Tax=Ornithobacterium rhinotracheale TaxID=28251 RepID=UPI001FF3DDBC|nr:hypothetical protein [Ornithobacterium rhinotracheale]MCK0206314.1 hypothetical protein [Ornithobacterium rhinotracheale]